MEPKDVKPGDELYVNTSLYIDHGEDDVCGGIAVVSRVAYKPVPQNPAAEYGDRMAHPCPDIPGHTCPNLMRRTRESILNIVGNER